MLNNFFTNTKVEFCLISDFLSSALIICGWDETEGACIYTVGMGGSVTKQKFAMSGSGSYVIHGYVDENYKENMTYEQCKEFLTKGKYLKINSSRIPCYV